jgi:deazaflavin-dependent oxidoreductase (nitroreductase family)
LPNIRWLLALITRVHRFIYVRSGGRIGSTLLSMKMLLLITVGRKSGQLRRTPLLYIVDAGRCIVVASNAGDPRDPAWWLNLQAKPSAQAQIGRERVEVTWRKADAAESDELWPKLTESYPFYPRYRERAGREIPIVILEPAETAGDPTRSGSDRDVKALATKWPMCN